MDKANSVHLQALHKAIKFVIDTKKETFVLIEVGEISKKIGNMEATATALM